MSSPRACGLPFRHRFTQETLWLQHPGGVLIHELFHQMLPDLPSEAVGREDRPALLIEVECQQRDERQCFLGAESHRRQQFQLYRLGVPRQETEHAVPNRGKRFPELPHGTLAFFSLALTEEDEGRHF